MALLQAARKQGRKMQEKSKQYNQKLKNKSTLGG
jgi:hypothetical protein